MASYQTQFIVPDHFRAVLRVPYTAFSIPLHLVDMFFILTFQVKGENVQQDKAFAIHILYFIKWKSTLISGK